MDKKERHRFGLGDIIEDYEGIGIIYDICDTGYKVIFLMSPLRGIYHGYVVDNQILSYGQEDIKKNKEEYLKLIEFIKQDKPVLYRKMKMNKININI